MNNYAAVPNEYRVPEYNPTGDSGNGYAGTVTPGAISNQINSSSGGASNNPYADILKYLPRARAASTPSLGDSPYNPAAGSDPVTTPVVPTASALAATAIGRTRPSAPPQVYSDANPPPHPGPNASLTEIGNYYRSFGYKNPAFSGIRDADIQAYWNDNKGMQFGDWYLAGNRAPADGPTTVFDNPNPTPTTPPVVPTPVTPTPTPTPTAPTPSFGAPPAPAATPPPASGAPASSDYSGILAQLQKLMGGQFDYESTQLNRRMNAQGAISGDLNSGGFGEVSGRANAQLAADQGNRLSGYLNTDWQSSLDRALQEYGINTQAATGRYAADAGVSAAAQGAGASMYGANIGLQEAQLRDATSRYQGNQQYDLGLAGLGLDKYKFDNPNINALLGYYLQMSPEQLAQFASNPTLFPGYTYTPHP